MRASEAFDQLLKLLAAAFPDEGDLRQIAGYANVDLVRAARLAAQLG